MPSDPLGSVRTDGGPVVHLRRPQDRVTIVLEPEPVAQWPGVLLPPFRVATAGDVALYAEPGAARPTRTIADHRTLDVHEIRIVGGWPWWRVTQGEPALWVRGAVLAR